MFDEFMMRIENESRGDRGAPKGLTPHFESEHRVLHKDGSFHWMLSEESRFMMLRQCFAHGWFADDITEGKVPTRSRAYLIGCYL